MVLVPVTSSQIVAVGYDFASRTMAIEFNPRKGGERSLYTYANVEPETAAAVVFAESVGKAFGEKVKLSTGKYPFTKVVDPSGFEVGSVEEELVWVAELKGFRRAA